jgi:nucleotide-binding universal stress UspA family protein
LRDSYALKLAEKWSATIVLLSVSYHAPYAPDKEYSSKIKAYHEKVLLDALNKVKSTHPHITISTKLAEGRPADTIVETAHKGNFDLIVMGGRGLGGIEEQMLGRTSDRVAHLARCPVLIVKRRPH